jgi:uncharacterized protein
MSRFAFVPRSTSRWLVFSLMAIFVSFLTACGGGTETFTEANIGSQPDLLPGVDPAAVVPSCPAASTTVTPISAIQGAALRSPMEGNTVMTQGVVTADFRASDKLSGFFIQQITSTFTANASRGIFVFAPGNTQTFAVGSYLQLSGTVVEFGSTTPGSSSVATQLSTPTNIVTCGTATMPTPLAVSLPVTTLTALELAEGMLVRAEQTLSVSEVFSLGRFGEIVLSANGRQFHPNNGNAAVTTEQNLLGRIILDDASTVQNPNPIPYLSAADTNGTRRLGDTVTGLQGILSYGFDAYRIQPTLTPTFVASNARNATAPAVAGALKVASFNVLNYFTTFTSADRGANNATEFARQKAKTVETIVGLDADVLGLIEMQNNGDTAVNDLVTALNTRLGTGTYAAIGSGTIGGDQIKVDIIYKPARVTKIGSAQLPTGADLVPFSASGTNRPPLAQRFASVANGGGFWFVINHFKSKGSCPSTGDVDAGQGCWNALRTQQATALNGFVNTLRTSSGENDVLMMGDFNNYLQEQPSTTMQGAGHESLLLRMPAANRYTYVFGGETGALDHAYASVSLGGQVSDVNVWHINGDEPPIFDYNTEFKTDDRWAATPFRSSDHDPVMVGLNLSADPVPCIPSISANVPAVGLRQGQVLTVNQITSGASSGCPAIQSLAINWGTSSVSLSLPLSTTQTSYTYTTTGSFTLTMSVTDASSTVSTLTRVISVDAPAVCVADTGPASLIFSEYIEGSSNNKALEIYNPTAGTVTLSNFVVRLYSNGALTPSNSLSLTGTLAPGAFVVLVNSSATTTLLTTPGAITSSVTNFNGDDAVTIELATGGIVDRIGFAGNDPGTEWAGSGVSTLNRTIRRKASIAIGETSACTAFDPSAQWDGFPQDTFNGLGIR